MGGQRTRITFWFQRRKKTPGSCRGKPGAIRGHPGGGVLKKQVRKNPERKYDAQTKLFPTGGASAAKKSKKKNGDLGGGLDITTWGPTTDSTPAGVVEQLASMENNSQPTRPSGDPLNGMFYRT